MADAINIRTLAKLAGVSTATVSLSLRNDPRIRAEVRKQVQQIATDAGYKPNPVIANLIAQVRGGKNSARQGTIGIIVPSENPSSIEMPAVQEWVTACEVRASQRGHGFDRFSLSENQRQSGHLAKIINARGIRGLIVVQPFSHGVIRPELDAIWQKTATIVIGALPTRPALSAVTHDHFFTAVRAMQEVARLGYRHPGICLHADIDELEKQRFIGGFSAESNGKPIPFFSFKPDAENKFKAWVKRHRPDVILTLHAGIRPWLESMGLSAPADIGLVHLDRTAGLSGWTGIPQQHELIGFAAVDMLIGQLQRNEFGPPPFQKRLFVYGTWLPGETVREQIAESRPSRRKAAAHKP